MQHPEVASGFSGRLVSSEGVWAFVPRSLLPPLGYRSELVELIVQAETELGTFYGGGARVRKPSLPSGSASATPL